ncbi:MULTISPECIES: ExbD/TolR family protein [Bizionia]|uniref:Biopolymer transporter ExbD n=1 Tax=Bizionia algoritergicola TaxID=291187 RepID=A0A5D0R3A5_9FLAO|nr:MULTISPECIES: biopolymer transporter ExbD [Bizionia]OBX23723.1 biopolymer transporter ExbD [Bizionia sp. APA-3]TYB75445.1 biopolymer transporter ExbD [Bizionia algoritergicola]
MAKRAAPEVNAGSMADIAFLLLIFFLVTTTIEVDSGLNRKLPPIEETDPPIIKERNIFQLTVNANNDLLLKAAGSDGDILKLKDLRKTAVAFLDNGGGTGEDACKSCKGKRNPESSDNYQKAIISLQNNRGTSYETYIAVQNEIIAAYNVLRNREFELKYPNLGINFVEADKEYSDARTSPSRKAQLKDKIEDIKSLIPQLFSEAEPKKSN